ncbi:MAG: J domain-containing protein [Kofleriaceae bacterium]
MDAKNLRRELGRGELVRLLYRLGRQQASGVLTIRALPSGAMPPPPPGSRERTSVGPHPSSPFGPPREAGPHVRGEVFVLRRGAVVIGDGELAKRTFSARLGRLVALERCRATFEGGIAAYPPGAAHQVALASWARTHLEAQLDNSLAERLVRDLAGIRLSVREDLAPEAQSCDEADRRILAAMAQPRRLDQIWPLARTPRFRMLAFLWFLRAIDALVVEGVVAERSGPNAVPRAIDPQRSAAARTLGLADHADVEQIKRAYRRLARSLHPDLQPEVEGDRRRTLEARFAEVTAAYEALI